MELRHRKWGFAGVIGVLAALLTVFLWQSPAPAQFNAQINAQINSQFGLSDLRLNQLSSEVAALRLQVSQLQAQIGGGGNRVPVQPSPRIAPAPQTQPNPAQFDRLATLVIELREDVRAIDDRLKAVEARLPRTAPQTVPQPSPRQG